MIRCERNINIDLGETRGELDSCGSDTLHWKLSRKTVAHERGRF